MTQLSIGTQDAATNMYDLAVLLAEGQSNPEDTGWEAFIDNLSRITDAFADARVKGDVETVETEELITV
jgi:hypothetical protein